MGRTKDQAAAYRRANPERIAEYRKRYRLAHPEKIAEYRERYRDKAAERGRKWRREHPVAVAEYKRTYRLKHLNDHAERQRKWGSRNPESIARTNAFQNAMRRFRAYAVLGGECSLCGIDDPTMLQFNHKDGGGREHRKKVGGGQAFIAWVIGNQQEAKDSIELLCANCHARLHSGFNAIEGYMIAL